MIPHLYCHVAYGVLIDHVILHALLNRSVHNNLRSISQIEIMCTLTI